MKDRIRQFIEHKGVTAGELAEITGVQRSNISHIFNGRNKPGAQFIEKFLLAFPEINARWLLTGEGSMFNESNIDNISSQRPVEVKSEPDVLYGTGQKIPQNDEKQVQKLILLNSDGTFTIYREDQSKQ
ncbi:MAG: helix-turn-helix transcriptional regulator [Prolixibacteraceae bacterium]|jgi:transcriptional regulator with XRE-family HTH domain|nr:helix-turn-helix transcriptional regulator [Prolixibacteraceae bacterium]